MEINHLHICPLLIFQTIHSSSSISVQYPISSRGINNFILKVCEFSMILNHDTVFIFHLRL